MPVHTRNRTISQIAIAQGGAGSTDLVAAPGLGMRIFVVAFVVVMSTGTGTVKFTEGTGPTDLTGAMQLAAQGGMVVMGDAEAPCLQTNTVNSKLSVVSATNPVNGWIRYFIAPDA